MVAVATGTFYGPGHDRRRDLHRGRHRHPRILRGTAAPATDARFSEHQAGVAVDRAGNILIADTHSGRIRVVAAADRHVYGFRP